MVVHLEQLADRFPMHQTGAHQRSHDTSFSAVPTTGLKVTTTHTRREQQHAIGPQIVWQIESDSDLSAPSLVQTRQTARHATQVSSSVCCRIRQLSETRPLSRASAVHSAVMHEDNQDKLLDDFDSMVAARHSANAASKPKHKTSVSSTVGFVPAFIAGDVFACKIPAGSEAMTPSGKDRVDQQMASAVPSVHLTLLQAIGAFGAPSGLAGMFATRAEAKVAAKELWEQQQQQEAQKLLHDKGMEEKRSPLGHVKAFFQSPPSLAKLKQSFTEKNEDDKVLEVFKKASDLISQAEVLLRQANRATGGIFFKELSVMPLPLAIAVELALNFPSRLRLVKLGTKTAANHEIPTQPFQSPWQGDKALHHPIEPGMTTFSIPGISFALPTTAGPLNFSPLFTSKHTAQVTWGVAQEMIATHEASRRKVHWQLKRAATELGATQLTGLGSRLEKVEPNEDEEGLAEPSEVQEFMQELGESDPR